MDYFSKFKPIIFEGKESSNPFSYRYYDPKQMVLGKTMEEQLRFAVCFWHSFCYMGTDAFGAETFKHPWLEGSNLMKIAHNRIQAGFQFIDKLNIPYFTFHDRDVAPEGKSLRESANHLQELVDHIGEEMQKTKKKLLWGTANLTRHPRYMSGAATNPDPDIFAYAAAQVKLMIDATHTLRGENYVLWGGREGYETILNTDMHREIEQLGRFMNLIVDYKYKIGFKGTLLIEPKPCEPTKHQYDFDCATVLAFLQKFGLEKEFKVNIEANHATLAGHTFEHEIAYALAHNFFGSLDINRGDPLLGWDTDQFPIDLAPTVYSLYLIFQKGGFATGGLNFDAKLRRQSINLEDLFHAHISGIDTLARCFLIATSLMEEKTFETFIQKRYQKWEKGIGRDVIERKVTIEDLAHYIDSNTLEPLPTSGQQELLENLLNYSI